MVPFVDWSVAAAEGNIIFGDGPGAFRGRVHVVHFRPVPLDLFHGGSITRKQSDSVSRLQIVARSVQSHILSSALRSTDYMVILPLSE